MSVRRVAVHKRKRAERAEQHRRYDAAYRDDGRGESAVFEVVQFCFESARKQYKNDAHLTEGVQNFLFAVAGFHKEPQRRVFVPGFMEFTQKPDDYTRYNHAGYLRQPEFSCDKPQTFCEYQDDGEIIKNV